MAALQGAGTAAEPYTLPSHRASGAATPRALVGTLLGAGGARRSEGGGPAVDCVLQASAIDRSSPLVATMRAHRSYWTSRDVTLFLLSQIVPRRLHGAGAAKPAPPMPSPRAPVGHQMSCMSPRAK